MFSTIHSDTENLLMDDNLNNLFSRPIMDVDNNPIYQKREESDSKNGEISVPS